MINRNEIINTLSESTKGKDYIHAMWIEGSEPQGFADEYSDIDLWFSVDDNMIFTIYEDFDAILKTLAPIDLKYTVKNEGELGHTVYHLVNTSEFLTIDINTQGKSRDVALINEVDKARVIFDKLGIVRFKEREKETVDINIKRQKLQGFYSQMHPSILKNIRRGKKLEALYYYHLVLRYATIFLRLKYDLKEKTDFDLKHIYRDMPEEVIRDLEKFYDVRISDLEMALTGLKDWIYKL